MIHFLFGVLINYRPLNGCFLVVLIGFPKWVIFHCQGKVDIVPLLFVLISWNNNAKLIVLARSWYLVGRILI